MRNLHRVRLAALVFALPAALLLAPSAQAAQIYSLVWTGTTGSGITGSSTIEAAPGDVLTLDALMAFDAGGGTGFDFDLVGSNVTAVSGEECPLGSSSGSLPNPVAGTCYTGASFLTPLAPGVSVQGNNILGYDAFSATPVGATAVIWVGRGVFVAQGAGQVALYDPSCGGDVCVGTSLPDAVATIVPEPGTAGLLALGVGALALRGSRRAWRD